MLFNSFIFALFLPLVFAIYWWAGAERRRLQNAILLVASYVFYGWWDWRFLGLIAFSSAVDYAAGIGLDRCVSKRLRRSLLCISLLCNLGLLGVFKYFNFFVSSLQTGLASWGAPVHFDTLEVILPVGISFYTFQTLSYTIDVYRKQIAAVYDPLAFFTYVSFFPQLVAGPIERARHLRPQFAKPRQFSSDMAIDGLRQILWGLFKKMVVADGCSFAVNYIFSHSDTVQGSTLWLGMFLFSFQIYGDFSGYSDIAIGVARLFGFDLMRNFKYPYFATNLVEFWKRWHMSLSSWFRDYVYIPLGGRRVTLLRLVRNIIVVFVVSGLWHGANWTFVVWGLYHAVWFLLASYLIWLWRGRAQPGAQDSRKRTTVRFRGIAGILATYLVVCLGWVLFRANDLAHALSYLRGMFSASALSLPEMVSWRSVLAIALMVCGEWVQRDQPHALQFCGRIHKRYLRWVIYYVVISLIVLLKGEQQAFVYFQF